MNSVASTADSSQPLDVAADGRSAAAGSERAPADSRSHIGVTVGRTKVFAAVFGAYTLLSVISCLKGAVMAKAAGQPVDWVDLIFQHAPWWYTWAVLTPVVVAVAARFRLDEPHRRWLAAVVHGLFAIVLASGHVLAVGALFSATGHRWLGMTSVADVMRSWYEIYVVPDMLTYVVIVGIYYAFDFAGRWKQSLALTSALATQGARLRQRQLDAHIQALRLQLNPHFLFNSLSAVVTLVQQGENRTAAMMLHRLSDLLRATLRRDDATEIPLRTELELLRLYLDIECVRFADRLSIQMDVDPGLSACLVPPMIVQPLVENAVRHGLGEREGAGAIRIGACREGDHLRIEVDDNGIGLARGATRAPSGGGLGLANVRERLLALYGETAGLSLTERPEGGARASVWMPLHTAIAAAAHA